MDLREVLNQQSLSVVHFAGHGSAQNHACIYCRRSQMACDLERPCTRCIKRNIGHLCHDEPSDNDSNNRKTIQTAQTPQTNTMDHTGAAEDQKYKILADFGRKHIKAWTNLSLANMNGLTADPDSSAEGLDSLSGPNTQTFTGESSNYLITSEEFYDVLSKNRWSPIAATTQSESFSPWRPPQAPPTFRSSLLPLKDNKDPAFYR
ncbi:uncharacterized protein FTJAE_12124 [Fusarium tjaetaba]|uniref:Zn(2)-C6 fungal-type domain-containing protein n=1 Tax=Fusarium tjaetaba TaxID=1567544 RepID=A0A8H5VBY9_9HYPO|nr:uncharacterized protein FTJAE_12124 [Fusarium tjaetaba]KAF5618857.1 hypothetical protein FTJAE_12124 [Fusarium tjaetaba]